MLKYFGEHHAFFVRMVQLVRQCNAVVMRTVFFLLDTTNCHGSFRHRKHFFSPQINFQTWFYHPSNHPEDSLFSLAAAQALALESRIKYKGQKIQNKNCLSQKFSFIIKTWCIDQLPGSFVVPDLRLVPEKKRRQFLEATTPRLKFVCCTF
jgi:hypothetical protein